MSWRSKIGIENAEERPHGEINEHPNPQACRQLARWCSFEPMHDPHQGSRCERRESLVACCRRCRRSCALLDHLGHERRGACEALALLWRSSLLGRQPPADEWLASDGATDGGIDPGEDLTPNDPGKRAVKQKVLHGQQGLAT